MKTLADMAGSKRFGFLGGKTLAECSREARQKWAQGNGLVWPNGPLQDRAAYAAPPELGVEDLKRHLALAAVPERLAGVIVSGLRDTPGVVAVRNWLNTDKSFAVLHGDVDAGKSVAAASMLLKAKRRLNWASGGYVDQWESQACVFELASEAAAMPLFGDDARAYWAHLERAKWLVLDDLGAEHVTEPWLSRLDGLMNVRHGKLGLRTVLTTNVSCRRPSEHKPSPFEERYGARIARRIRDAGQVISVTKEAA